MNFTIKKENILESFSDAEYVYSKTYERIYKRLGEVNEDSTILVDVDGNMNDFILLEAKNTNEVVSISKDFNYKEYSKNCRGNQKEEKIKQNQ